MPQEQPENAAHSLLSAGLHPGRHAHQALLIGVADQTWPMKLSCDGYSRLSRCQAMPTYGVTTETLGTGLWQKDSFANTCETLQTE